MQRCFHFTKKENLDSIMELGLIPKYESNCKLLEDDRGSKVFYAVGFEGIVRIIANFYSMYGRVKDGRVREETFSEGHKKIIEDLTLTSSFEEWMGDGVILLFDSALLFHKNEEKNYDAYTSDTIEPEGLSVCAIVDNDTNEVVSTNQIDVVNFMIARLSYDMKDSLKFADFYAVNYSESIEEFRDKNYSLNVIPLHEFIMQNNSVKHSI